MLFIAHTELEKFIDYVDICINSEDFPAYPKAAKLSIAYSEDGIVGDISLDVGLEIPEWRSITFSEKTVLGELYYIRSNGIVITGRSPFSSRRFENVQLSLRCLTYRQLAAAGSRVEVKVASPLTAEVLDGRLLLGVKPSHTPDSASESENRLLTINGIRPDDNGNFTITSKSPEILINVYNSTEAKV